MWYFNSIKVRLKLLSVGHLYPEPIIIFQFHKGTIKTYLKDKPVRGTTEISIP